MKSVFIFIIIAIAMALLMIAGLRSFVIPAKFHNGQIINMIAFGKRGMIIRSDCFKSCRYAVRFLATQSTTNTHFLAPDSAISVAPISLVYNIKEFEIEAID